MDSPDPVLESNDSQCLCGHMLSASLLSASLRLLNQTFCPQEDDSVAAGLFTQSLGATVEGSKCRAGFYFQICRAQ